MIQLEDPYFDTLLTKMRQLPTGIVCTLARAGLRTLGELFMAAESNSLSRITGLGPVSIEKIKTFLWAIYEKQSPIHPELLYFLDLFPGKMPLDRLIAYPGSIMDASVRMLHPKPTTWRLLIRNNITTFGAFMNYPFDKRRLREETKEMERELCTMKAILTAFLQVHFPETIGKKPAPIPQEDNISITDLALPASITRKLLAEGYTKASDLLCATRTELLTAEEGSFTEGETCRIDGCLTIFYYIPPHNRITGLPEENINAARKINHMILSSARYLGTEPVHIARYLERAKVRKSMEVKKYENSAGGGVTRSTIEQIFLDLLSTVICSRLLSTIGHQNFLLRWADLRNVLPDFFQEDRFLSYFLNLLEDGGWIYTASDGSVRLACITLLIYMDNLTQRDARILRMRLFGVTYEEACRRLSMSERTVRRRFVNAMTGITGASTPLAEDYFLPLFEELDLTWEDFHSLLPLESHLTYQYLTYRTRGIKGRRKLNGRYWEG